MDYFYFFSSGFRFVKCFDLCEGICPIDLYKMNFKPTFFVQVLFQ